MERKHCSAAKLSFFVSFLFMFQFGWILAETCEKIDNCSCRKSNGKVINLREIGGPSGPAWVHLVATKPFFFHEWVSSNLKKKSPHYLCRLVNKPIVVSNSILKVAPFQIGFASSMDSCITNGQLSGSEAGKVTLSFWPMCRYRHVLGASLVMIGYRNQSSEN